MFVFELTNPGDTGGTNSDTSLPQPVERPPTKVGGAPEALPSPNVPIALYTRDNANTQPPEGGPALPVRDEVWLQEMVDRAARRAQEETISGAEPHQEPGTAKTSPGEMGSGVLSNTVDTWRACGIGVSEDVASRVNENVDIGAQANPTGIYPVLPTTNHQSMGQRHTLPESDFQHADRGPLHVHPEGPNTQHLPARLVYTRPLSNPPSALSRVGPFNRAHPGVPAQEESKRGVETMSVQNGSVRGVDGSSVTRKSALAAREEAAAAAAMGSIASVATPSTVSAVSAVVGAASRCCDRDHDKNEIISLPSLTKVAQATSQDNRRSSPHFGPNIIPHSSAPTTWATRPPAAWVSGTRSRTAKIIYDRQSAPRLGGGTVTEAETMGTGTRSSVRSNVISPDGEDPDSWLAAAVVSPAGGVERTVLPSPVLHPLRNDSGSDGGVNDENTILFVQEVAKHGLDALKVMGSAHEVTCGGWVTGQGGGPPRHSPTHAETQSREATTSPRRRGRQLPVIDNPNGDGDWTYTGKRQGRFEKAEPRAASGAVGSEPWQLTTGSRCRPRPMSTPGNACGVVHATLPWPRQPLVGVSVRPPLPPAWSMLQRLSASSPRHHSFPSPVHPQLRKNNYISSSLPNWANHPPPLPGIDAPPFSPLLQHGSAGTEANESRSRARQEPYSENNDTTTTTTTTITPTTMTTMPQLSALVSPSSPYSRLAAENWFAFRPALRQFEVVGCGAAVDYRAGVGGKAGWRRIGAAGSENGKRRWCAVHQQEGSEVCGVLGVCSLPGCRSGWSWSFPPTVDTKTSNLNPSCTEQKHEGMCRLRDLDEVVADSEGQGSDASETRRFKKRRI